MVGTLDQFPFPVHSFCFAHFIGTGLQFTNKILYLYQTAHFICSNRIPERFQSRFNVVKIRNGFKQWITRQVSQHFLKFAKSESGPVSQFGIYLIVTFAIPDKIHHPPVRTLCILIKKFSAGCGNEGQHLTVDIVNPCIHQFLADMHRYAQNIALQFRDVLKNRMINTL